MGKDSADLFFRSFPREAIVGSRDVEGRDVHPSISFVRHFLYRLRPSQQRNFFFFLCSSSSNSQIIAPAVGDSPRRWTLQTTPTDDSLAGKSRHSCHRL